MAFVVAVLARNRSGEALGGGVVHGALGLPTRDAVGTVVVGVARALRLQIIGITERDKVVVENIGDAFSSQSLLQRASDERLVRGSGVVVCVCVGGGGGGIGERKWQAQPQIQPYVSSKSFHL